jgi:uncharacterized membrane protein YdjX (TVP38/TMEM64 family)
MRRFLRILGLLAVLAIPVAVTQLPPVRAALLSVVAVMRSEGAPGVALYVAVYVAGGLLTAPVALLSGMAGYAYGPVRGLLIASPACVLSATTTFLIGRFALRAAIERRLAKTPRIAAITRAVAMDGLRITTLLRLTPITPQNFLSYALSTTRVRPLDFAVGTWIGLLPITAFQVYLGSLVRDASELFDASRAAPASLAMIAPLVGVVVSVIALLLIARTAKRALNRSLAAFEEPDHAKMIAEGPNP